jgi:hypothetical protein
MLLSSNLNSFLTKLYHPRTLNVKRVECFKNLSGMTDRSRASLRTKDRGLRTEDWVENTLKVGGLRLEANSQVLKCCCAEVLLWQVAGVE